MTTIECLNNLQAEKIAQNEIFAEFKQQILAGNREVLEKELVQIRKCKVFAIKHI